jgi:hypothetical protein
MFFPAFNWNKADGFMAGVALHNGTIIPKPVEFSFFPFYSFLNSGLTGYGKITFNKTPYDNFIRLAKFTLEGSQFGALGNQNYHEAKIGLDLFFRPNSMINPINQKIFGYYIAASDLSQILSSVHSHLRSYLQMGYLLEKIRTVNPFDVLVSFESEKSYQKTSLEVNYKYSYFGKKNGLEVRFFAGAMLKNDSQEPFYTFSASGRSGRENYFYQGVYLDRFSEFPKTFWSRQMTLSEGGLVTPVNDSLGYSRWICSLSLTTNLPGKASRIPVKPFVNLLLNDNGQGTINRSPIFFEAGLKAGIWDFFEIYFPLLVSDNIDALAGSLKGRIRFVFKLDKLNPSRLKS